MDLLESIIELIKLVMFIIFVSAVGAQLWIAFLDISRYFTDIMEKFRPVPSQDKYSRIAVIIGVFVIIS